MMRALMLLLLPVSGLLAEEASLNVITYNIRNDTVNDKGPRDWSQRKGPLTDYLLRSKASIIGLQEVRHNQLLDVGRALPGHAHVGVGREDGRTAGEYCPVFYDQKLWKLDPQEHGTFWLSDTPDVPNSRTWGNYHPRICTWARLVASDGSENPAGIYVYNTHWDYSSQVTQLKSAELMLKMIRERNHQNEPFIVMGDLNATTEDPPVKHLLESGPLLDHGKIQMRSSNEWNAALVPGRRIDHIFTSPSIQLAEMRVESNPGSAGLASSDHHPARLTIPRRPAVQAAPTP
jgi:endonuclease/exonuclease/phosphatase family metal-dependent hydrolase